ncbi:MAG: hypothetical protein LBK59_10380 [Bifidobacteriaceae bacterium]|nr:hypothetical protein [Bifidobacteriaceae bacterium]
MRHRSPRVFATVRGDGTGEVVIGGRTVPIEGGDLAEAGRLAVEVAAARAAQVGRPVRMAATSPAGTRLVVVHPDGRLTPDDDASRRPRTSVLLAAGVLTVLLVLGGWMALRASPPGRASQDPPVPPAGQSSSGSPVAVDPADGGPDGPEPVGEPDGAMPVSKSSASPNPLGGATDESPIPVPPGTSAPDGAEPSANAPLPEGPAGGVAEVVAPEPVPVPEGSASSAPEVVAPPEPAWTPEVSTDAPQPTAAPTAKPRSSGATAHAPAKGRTGASRQSGGAGRAPARPDSSAKGFVLWQEE